MRFGPLATYIVYSIVICSMFAVAAYSGVRFPKINVAAGGGSGGSTYSRYHGGSWGGGK